jgi:hypothetical protein
MGTGVIAQLVKTNESNRSSYIIKNPDISYFRFAYKKHTNFAMQSIKLTFNTKPYLNKDSNKFKCPINKNNADMVTDFYFRYELPDIYSNDKYKFRWIPNFGTLLIKRADLWINNIIIDTITGEWLIISNELTENVKDNYDKISGNLSTYTDPKMDVPIITINNNRFFNTYPSSDKNNDTPSIKGREIIIPLSFNLTKNPSLGLLLTNIIAVDGVTNNIFIELVLEDIENLYQVYSSDLNMYISPSFYNDLYPNDKISFETFTKTKEINPYIEANYVYLDNSERTLLQTTSPLDIVMDQIFISSDYSLTPGNNLLNSVVLMKCNTHIKEILWTIKRDDYYKFNTPLNYTNSIPENAENPIMSKARIMYNKSIERVDENNANYFNLMQPYKHHANIPKQGIYCYSYALFPDKYQPSGSVDCGSIETTLDVFTNNQDNSFINNKLIKFGRLSPYSYSFRLNYYVRGINILRYINGNVAYLFSS